jgi:tetratricopeptide (TPR) repeat protein
MTRLEQLEEFAKADPEDPFNLYALALEYQKSDRHKALAIFNDLTTHHDKYIPTYYHFGKLCIDVGDPEKAKMIFEKGIVLAGQHKELKAMRELKAALDELMHDL